MPTPFPVGPVNAYLVKTDPLILIDAGVKTDDAWEALNEGLAAAGYEPRDLGMILLTHGHLDHMGLTNRLVEASGAETYAHPHVVEQVRRFEESDETARAFWVDIMGEFGVPPEVIETVKAEQASYKTFGEELVIGHGVEDGQQVGPFKALHVPGHSASDTLYVSEEAGIAFTGDHLLQTMRPNPLIRRPKHGEPRPKSLIQYRRSLQRTLKLNVEVCYPGHGGPIHQHRDLIGRELARHDRKANDILGLMRDRDELTPYTLSRMLFPKLDVTKLYLGLSVAVGFLELLEERGQAVSAHREGVLYYSAR